MTTLYWYDNVDGETLQCTIPPAEQLSKQAEQLCVAETAVNIIQSVPHCTAEPSVQSTTHRSLSVDVSVCFAFAWSYFDVTRHGGARCVQDSLFTYSLISPVCSGSVGLKKSVPRRH